MVDSPAATDQMSFEFDLSPISSDSSGKITNTRHEYHILQDIFPKLKFSFALDTGFQWVNWQAFLVRNSDESGRPMKLVFEEDVSQSDENDGFWQEIPVRTTYSISLTDEPVMKDNIFPVNQPRPPTEPFPEFRRRLYELYVSQRLSDASVLNVIRFMSSVHFTNLNCGRHNGSFVEFPTIVQSLEDLPQSWRDCIQEQDAAACSQEILSSKSSLDTCAGEAFSLDQWTSDVSREVLCFLYDPNAVALVLDGSTHVLPRTDYECDNGETLCQFDAHNELFSHFCFDLDSLEPPRISRGVHPENREYSSSVEYKVYDRSPRTPDTFTDSPGRSTDNFNTTKQGSVADLSHTPTLSALPDLSVDSDRFDEKSSDTITDSRVDDIERSRVYSISSRQDDSDTLRARVFMFIDWGGGWWKFGGCSEMFFRVDFRLDRCSIKFKTTLLLSRTISGRALS
eukprot:179045_1